MGGISRRDFLRLGAGAAVTLGAAPLLTNVMAPAALAMPAKTARVAAVKGDDLYKMTREILEAMGGMGNVVHEGEKVFVKPNMVTLPWAQYNNPFVKGECTKPEILITVAEECLKAGASEVIIGDGSQMPQFDWSKAKTLDGSTDLVQAAASLSEKYPGKVTLACLEVDTPEWIDVPTGISLGKVAVSSLVTRADRVISVPVAKTHEWAGMTLSMKNFIGITPLKRYGWEHSRAYSRDVLHRHDYKPEQISQLYFDLTAAAKPHLAIVDFSIGLEGNGPTIRGGKGGRTVNVKDRLGSWLLLASTDPAAADATAARVMGHDDAFVNRVLGKAPEQGLGVISEESIEVVGARLDDLRLKWQPAKIITER